MESKRKTTKSRSIKAIKRDFEYLHEGWYLKVKKDEIHLLDKDENMVAVIDPYKHYRTEFEVPNGVLSTFINYANEIIKDKLRRKK